MLHCDACCQATIIQHDKITFTMPEIQKKNRQGNSITIAKKKGKTKMGLKEVVAEAKKKGKMEMGLPQRLRKRKRRG